MSQEPHTAKDCFFDALELQGEEREAFVASLEMEHSALGTRVRELLAAHEASEHQFSAPGAILPRVTPSGLGSSGAELRGGQTVGSFRLLEPIGEGGFGQVWAAEQEGTLRRTVALKVLRSGVGSRDVVARFEAERQALALMNHPCIARVFDGGVTEAGRPWFAMEMVDGAPITDFCEERGLSLRERVSLFLDVCRAVQHAHQKGVIHRDLKPTNVLVGEVDGDAAPKVIDFGIAKAIDQNLTEDTLQTLGGQLVGTPAYMSPEQVDSSSDVDTRTDVYSLGVLLYELVCGTTPFAREGSGSSNAIAILNAIREEDPQRPSTRAHAAAVDTRERRMVLARELRGDLDWIILRCLEKDRERRYDSAAVLANELERYLAGEPVLAGPPTVSYRLSKFVGRYKMPIGFTAALFALLIAGIFVANGQASRAREAERQSTLDAANARKELARFEGIAELLEHVLLSLDPEVARGKDPELMLQILDRARSHIDDAVDPLPEVEAEVRRLIGGAYLSLARYEEAKAEILRALELREQVLPGDHPDLAESLEEAGGLHMVMARLDLAEPLLGRAHETYVKSLGREDERTIHVLVNLATVHHQLGQDEVARVEFEELLPWYVHNKGVEDATCQLIYNNLASTLRDLGQDEEALAMFTELLTVQRELSPDSPRTLSTMNNMGSLFTSLGRYDEALALIEESLEVKQRVLPKGHPSVLVGMSSLARIHEEIEDTESALALYDEAIALGSEALPPEDKHNLILLCRRAVLLVELERFEEGLEDARLAAELARASYAEDSPLLASVNKTLDDVEEAQASSGKVLEAAAGR